MTIKQRALEFENSFREIFNWKTRRIEKPFDADGVESGTLYQCILNAFNKLEVSEEEQNLFIEKYKKIDGYSLRKISNIEQLQNDYKEIVSRYQKQ